MGLNWLTIQNHFILYFLPCFRGGLQSFIDILSRKTIILRWRVGTPLIMSRKIFDMKEYILHSDVYAF